MIFAKNIEPQGVTAVANDVDADTELRPVVVAGRSYRFKLILKLDDTEDTEHGLYVDFSPSTCKVDGTFQGQSGVIWAQMTGASGGSMVSVDTIPGSGLLSGGGAGPEFVDDVPKFVVVEGFIRPTVGGELRPGYAHAAGEPSGPIVVGLGSMMIVEECKGQE